MNNTGNCGTRSKQLLLALMAMGSFAGVQAQTIISEVLYDAGSTDNGNVFVELFGPPGTLLDGWLLQGVKVQMEMFIEIYCWPVRYHRMAYL